MAISPPPLGLPALRSVLRLTVRLISLRRNHCDDRTTAARNLEGVLLLAARSESMLSEPGTFQPIGPDLYLFLILSLHLRARNLRSVFLGLCEAIEWRQKLKRGCG